MDIVFLRELRADAVIGVFDWERRVRQVLSLDLELAVDCRAAAAHDSLEGTLDYQAIAQRVIEFVGQSDCHLIETLAERTAALLLAEFPVRWLRLTLSKPAALREARAVGVVIERGSRD